MRSIATAIFILLLQVASMSKVHASAGINVLDGHWYSKEWRYGYLLESGVGKATSTNSPNFKVGQEIIFLEDSVNGVYNGRQVYTDGKFYAVRAVLQPNGELHFSGERNARWVMRRAPEPAKQSGSGRTSSAPSAPLDSMAEANRIRSELRAAEGEERAKQAVKSPPKPPNSTIGESLEDLTQCSGFFYFSQELHEVRNDPENRALSILFHEGLRRAAHVAARENGKSKDDVTAMIVASREKWWAIAKGGGATQIQSKIKTQREFCEKMLMTNGAVKAVVKDVQAEYEKKFNSKK